MYYSSFGLLSIIIHVIINIEGLRKPQDPSREPIRVYYRRFLLGVMLYYISDVLWGFLYDTGIVALAYADTVLYFFSMVLSLLWWMKYVVAYLNHKSVFDKILVHVGWVIFDFQIIILIINFFNPIMFTFDKDKVYDPGYARYITLTAELTLFFVLSIYSLVTSIGEEKADKRHHLTVGLSGLIMTAFIILQTIYPLLPFYAIGCLLATCLIHTFVVMDERDARIIELGSAKIMAYKDPLTNVRNKAAYMESKSNVEKRIRSGDVKDFGLVVFDLNGLKAINDTLGHEEGDKYIKEGCMLICKQFKHSPVFRIGGDEFIVFLEGEDFDNREDLLVSFNEQVERNLEEGLVVVSSGLDIFDPDKDTNLDTVFERADSKMYERKKALKSITIFREV